VRELTGKTNYPDVKNVFIMGASNTAVHAIWNMPDGMHAKIFEPDAKRCEWLNEHLAHHNNVLVINGDGNDPNLLIDEGIQKAEAFAALTGNSEQNILACLSARRLGIRKTVAMVENTDYIKVAENLDIGYIINKKTFAASHIYQMMLKADITTMKNLVVANADVAEFHVHQGAKITKKAVKDLDLPSTVTLGGLVRNGRGQLINGQTIIEPEDTVVAFCLENEVKRLERYFK
jgi:trk system potassium uptake protein TrkA